MNTDVVPASLSRSDPAWVFPPHLSSCENMYPGDPVQVQVQVQVQDPDPDPDPGLLEARLDFFHKLGYSTAQVQAVQQTLGLGSDTDKVLGQLVRGGRGGRGGPVTTLSVLVPGGGGPASSPALLMPVSRDAAVAEDDDALRPVVIDGSNVAMSHGNKEVFSCLGIQLAVSFFLDRGHADITVFVPSWRKEQPRPDVPITDQHILLELEKKKILVFTPSRRCAGKRVVCNDDCFIVKHAFESDGIIVSNDLYRDLQGTKPEWKRFIEDRLLMYSFVNNKFMPPDDPLGRYGPTLDNFLRRFPKTQKKQQCPYGKKCTYGIKCKFHHPERAKQSNRTLADQLRDNAKNPAAAQKVGGAYSGPAPGQSLLQVEDMARKLSLGPDSSALKKEQKNNKQPVKTGHRQSKRASSRKASPQGDPVRLGGSQEQLDSGLGSIDSQAVDPWPYGTQQNLRQQFSPPRSSSCSCCSQNRPAFQHHAVGPPGRDAVGPPGCHGVGQPGRDAVGPPGCHGVGPPGCHGVGPPGCHGVGPPGCHGVGPPGCHGVGPPGCHGVGPPGRDDVGPPGCHGVGPPGCHGVGPPGCHGVGPPGCHGVGPPGCHGVGQPGCDAVGPPGRHGADMLPFGPPPYGYRGYPVSVPAYGQPCRVQQQQPFWSDPFAAHPPVRPSPWEPPPPPPPSSRKQPSSEEREVVRKKLLAIFSAPLVDAAMDAAPLMMDPQKLVAEILVLQSQNRSLR